MRIIADMHTHTVASGHAYSTVNELAAEAARKQLSAIAITDHGPALPGGPHLYHFGAIRFIPRYIQGVRIFLGVEANIINSDGMLDLPDEYLDNLEFIMAGLHENCGLDNLGISANTTTVIKAMQNPRLKAVSHPGNPAFPLDYEAIVQAAKDTSTALEINNSSLSISRRGSRPNCERLARLVARIGAPVVVGSDAHVAQSVGEFAEAVGLLREAGVAETQIINTSLSRLATFLGTSEAEEIRMA